MGISGLELAAAAAWVLGVAAVAWGTRAGRVSGAEAGLLLVVLTLLPVVGPLASVVFVVVHRRRAAAMPQPISR